MYLSDQYTRIALLTEDIIYKLSQKYKYVTQDDIKYINSYLSTYGNKGDLLTEWVVKSVSRGSGRIPEDLTRFVNAASFYFNAVKTDKFKGVVRDRSETLGVSSNPKNILDFTLHDIEDIEELYEQPEVDPRVNQLEANLPEGTKILFNDGHYQIIQVDSAEAACQLAKGTKWCTSDTDTAQHYLDQSPLYVIHQSGRKIGQLHIGGTPDSIQLMDLRDRDINPDINLIHVLIKAGLYVKILMALAHPEYEDHGETKRWLIPDPEVEEMVATNGLLSLRYAHHVLNNRFLHGEPAIAEDAYSSFAYWHYCMGGQRFKLGEPAIIKVRNKLYEYMYLLRFGNRDLYKEFISDWKESPEVQYMLRTSFKEETARLP